MKLKYENEKNILHIIIEEYNIMNKDDNINKNTKFGYIFEIKIMHGKIQQSIWETKVLQNEEILNDDISKHLFKISQNNLKTRTLIITVYQILLNDNNQNKRIIASSTIEMKTMKSLFEKPDYIYQDKILLNVQLKSLL